MTAVHSVQRLRGQMRRRGSAVKQRLRRLGKRVRTHARQGTPREIAAETTNVGPIMDAAVLRARKAMLPAGQDADYDLAYEHFDVLHFLLQSRHLLRAGDVDPLQYFLDNGSQARSSPEANFSMQAYLARYPDKDRPGSSPYVDWLKKGKDAGEIADPAPGLEKMAPVLGMELGELVKTVADTRSDLHERLRTGRLGAMFARAAEVEPLIGDVWTEAMNPTLPPLVSTVTADQVAAMHTCQQAARFDGARLVMVASDPRWGGGRRMEGHIAHALTGPAGQLEPRDIVVIYTEKGGAAPPRRFPAGVREVDFAGAVEGLDRIAARRTLLELIRSLHADAVVNINSRVLYEAISSDGKALAASERLFPLMFCNEQLAMGSWVGVPLRFFYRCFDVVDGIVTDSAYLRSWLLERHQLGTEQGSRVHLLSAPVDPEAAIVPVRASDSSRRPQVFWAGRWDRQKRVELALEVARRMPDLDFRMWGESVLTPGHVDEAPVNVRLEGAYAHLHDLDLENADVWLYTSGWDGVPSQLLEVGMTGIPIVGSLVGGTGEVLKDEDSWPVADRENPAAYVQAIRDVLTDRARARVRALTLRERLIRERTEADFAEHVAALLLHDRTQEHGEEPAG